MRPSMMPASFMTPGMFPVLCANGVPAGRPLLMRCGLRDVSMSFIRRSWLAGRNPSSPRAGLGSRASISPVGGVRGCARRADVGGYLLLGPVAAHAADAERAQRRRDLRAAAEEVLESVGGGVIAVGVGRFEELLDRHRHRLPMRVVADR